MRNRTATRRNAPPEEAIAAAEEAAGCRQAAPEEPTPAPWSRSRPQSRRRPPGATPAVVEQRFATVISAYGVNARAPDTGAEIIRILSKVKPFRLWRRAGGRRKLAAIVGDGQPLTDGQPVTGEVGYAAADFMAEGAQPISQELYEQAMLAGGFTVTPEEAEPTPAEEAAATLPAEEEAEPGVVLPTVTPASGAEISQPTDVSVTVDAPSGLNARTLPDLTSEVVRLLLDQETVPAISRLANNEWILADLGDGAQGWVSAAFIVIDGDVNTLPVTAPGELPQPTPTPAETPTPEAEAIAARQSLRPL